MGVPERKMMDISGRDTMHRGAMKAVLVRDFTCPPAPCCGHELLFKFLSLHTLNNPLLLSLLRPRPPHSSPSLTWNHARDEAAEQGFRPLLFARRTQCPLLLHFPSALKPLTTTLLLS